jgi:hypothetical protein
MDAFDDAFGAEEVDPAAEFLAKEQEELADLGEDLGFAAPPAQVGSQGADPHPPSPVREGRQVEITHLLPTGIGERFSQSISNLGHAALLRRCELPL